MGESRLAIRSMFALPRFRSVEEEHDDVYDELEYLEHLRYGDAEVEGDGTSIVSWIFSDHHRIRQAFVLGR